VTASDLTLFVNLVMIMSNFTSYMSFSEKHILANIQVCHIDVNLR